MNQFHNPKTSPRPTPHPVAVLVATLVAPLAVLALFGVALGHLCVLAWEKLCSLPEWVRSLVLALFVLATLPFAAAWMLRTVIALSVHLHSFAP